MSDATSYVVAAGAVVMANKLVPAAINTKNGTAQFASAFNWTLVRSTVLMAVALNLVNQVAPGFGDGLAKLVLLSVFVIPVDSGPTPIETFASLVTPSKS